MSRSKPKRPLRLALGGIGAAGVEFRPDPVHVERLVAEQGGEIQTLEALFGFRGVGRQREVGGSKGSLMG
jgi:hypothetical protein